MFALQLNTEITGFNEAREREVPLIQEIDAKVKELRQTIGNLNNQQASLRVTLRRLKDKAGEVDEKVRLLIFRTLMFPFNSLVEVFVRPKKKKKEAILGLR